MATTLILRYSGNSFDGPIEIPSKTTTKVYFCIRGRKIVTGHVLWTFQYVNLSYSFEKAIAEVTPVKKLVSGIFLRSIHFVYDILYT